VSALRVERDGAVLRIAMARPERRNAFDAALIDELATAFADVGDARGVVLSGDGSSFSAGADVDWMRSSARLTYEENVADAMRLRGTLEAIDGCPAPVLARVQGHALGGGCGLVACCDIVIAEPAAQFAFTEVKLGIVPAVISPFALAKIGPAAARRYFVTGERFSADVALRIGLVHEIADDLDTALDRALGELLSAGPAAARIAKELARAPAAADETARRIAEQRTSPEGQEGLGAFLDGSRRPLPDGSWPPWSGAGAASD
jgi:methylglutaconyl-CoA hydratase